MKLPWLWTFSEKTDLWRSFDELLPVMLACESKFWWSKKAKWTFTQYCDKLWNYTNECQKSGVLQFSWLLFTCLQILLEFISLESKSTIDTFVVNNHNITITLPWDLFIWSVLLNWNPCHLILAIHSYKFSRHNW